jgi:hypothetical protein
MPFNPPWTSYFNDAIFTSSDTGYYCYTVYAPSQSTPNDVFLKKTTDDCNSWNIDYQNSALGISSYAVKYFNPYIYYLWNDQGIYRINWKLENSNWQSLPFTFGYYRDFFANDSSNYKILYSDYSKRVIQRFFQNNVEIRTDTFPTNKPSKMFYPTDTVGILLSLSSPSTGYNTVILKYTPSTGYNTAFQNQNQKLSDVYFPSINVGYVACDSGIVLRSNDLGSNWTALNTGYLLKLNSVFFVNDSTGYVVGDSGLILSTTNYGLTWQQQSSPVNTPLNKVFFVNDSVGYILSGQTLLKTINGGLVWVNEIFSKTQFLSVFPNPTTKISTIKIPNDLVNKRHIQIYLYDSYGKCVRQYQIENYPETYSINFESEARGLYTILIRNEDKIYYSKIVLE